MPNAKPRGLFSRPHADPRYRGRLPRRVARTQRRYHHKTDRWAATAEAASIPSGSRSCAQMSRSSSSPMPAGAQVYWRGVKELMASTGTRVTTIVGVTMTTMGVMAVATAVAIPRGLGTPPGIGHTTSVATDTPRPPPGPRRTCLRTAFGWPDLASTLPSSLCPIKGEKSGSCCAPGPPFSSSHPRGTLRSRHRTLIRQQQENAVGRGRELGGRS